MWAARQVALGLAYALIPALLVIGGLALAMTEASPAGPAAISPTFIPSTAPPQAKPSSTLSRPPETARSPTASSSPQPTSTQTATSSPTNAAITPVSSLTPTASPTELPAQGQEFDMQAEGCGPFPGWIWGYVVRPGDSWFRIASRYQTTTAELQHANCKSDSAVFPGERLWVPAPPPSRWGFPFFRKFVIPWGHHIGPGRFPPDYP